MTDRKVQRKDDKDRPVTMADAIDDLMQDDVERIYYSLKVMREILRRQGLELRCIVMRSGVDVFPNQRISP